MDLDENDLLATNTFIKNPDITTNIPSDANEQFKNYYEKEIKRKKENDIISSLDLKNLVVDETTDNNNLLNTNVFKVNKNNLQQEKGTFGRKMTEVKTLVSIDSRDRDKVMYSKPNNFKIFLGKTFYNVRTIKLISVEFPNTNAVINSGNNNIYWRNKEDIDIDNTTATYNTTSYPVYSSVLRIGSYITSTLTTELQNKMDAVRRNQGRSTAKFHYFVITLNVDTDIVTFISLILTPLANNPFSVTINTGSIIVTANGHGLSNNQKIYIEGAKTIAGIPAESLNGFQIITVNTTDTFTFEVNVNASTTVIGGGNIAYFGVQAPFQLLWGEYQNTVAQNLGFPLENSSQMMTVTITNVDNIYQMTIQTKTPHGLSSESIGNQLKLGYYSGNTFISSLSYLITGIIDSLTILVQIPSNTLPDNLDNSTYIQYISLSPIEILGYQLYSQKAFMITTKTPHGYTLDNIGNSVTLSGTLDPTSLNDTGYDGDYTILQVINSTELVLIGFLSNLNKHTNNIYGSIPKVTPITTQTVKILNIEQVINENINSLKITCDSPHKLNVNDSIMFYNIYSSPSLTTSSQIVSVIINDTEFMINSSVTGISQNTILDGTAYFGTSLITVNLPAHGFNKILRITQVANNMIIQTYLPHNLTNSNKVRIMETTTTPSIDGYHSIISYTTDTFTININKIIVIPTVVTGIIGMSNNFYLYGIKSFGGNTIGGILPQNINGIEFDVRDIIDEDTFTFIIPNRFATSTETDGGNNVYISSYLHGYNGTQTNTKNDLLNRSINLEGENYAFLTCPQLDTVKNTGNVKNIFARITLDQAPGYVCFNFLSEPKQFNIVPLDLLSELEFSIVNHNDTLYEFNDLDYSFTIEITEVQDTSDLFNHSSRRGINDIS